MTQSGEVSVEEAPYKDQEVVAGACQLPPSSEDLVCPVEMSEAEVRGELERTTELRWARGKTQCRRSTQAGRA